MSLFDEWEKEQKQKAAEIKKQAKQQRPAGQQCRNCRFFMAHQYTDKINYCTASKNPRTSYGYAKTTRLGWCGNWKGEA